MNLQIQHLKSTGGCNGYSIKKNSLSSAENIFVEYFTIQEQYNTNARKYKKNTRIRNREEKFQIADTFSLQRWVLYLTPNCLFTGLEMRKHY